jgi:hypothetical protein
MGSENFLRKPLVRGPCPPGGRAAGQAGLTNNDSDDNDNQDSDDNEHDQQWPCMGKCKGTGREGPVPGWTLPSGRGWSLAIGSPCTVEAPGHDHHNPPIGRS